MINEPAGAGRAGQKQLTRGLHPEAGEASTTIPRR